MREAVAAAYGWSPPVIDELDLVDLRWWADAADQRLKAHASRGCVWRT